MRRKIAVLTLAFSCIISVLCTGISTRAKSIYENELEDYIMEGMSAANILGVGISVVSSDKELYCAAYGAVQKTESDYVLGALSQSFTAAGIMRMVEDGDLSLEDKVSDYLPKYKKAADVTVQELLRQTSGITMKQQMSGLEVTGAKGEFQFAYANYNLLGEIIEEVSGMSYEEYISDNILDSLDMTSTYSLRIGSDESQNLLTGFRNYFGFPYTLKYQYNEADDWIKVPSGHMISDIKDMGKYLQMYLKEGSDVLSKASVSTMLYDGVDVPPDSVVSKGLFDDSSAKYGMGWAQKEVNGKTILYQTGIAESFTSLMVLLPEQDLGITMLFNSMDYLVGQKLIQSLEEGVISIELGETPAKVDSRSYLLKHGIIDVLMLLALLAAWMPIFLMGGWIRRRKAKLIYVPALVLDVLVQIVLPTVLLIVLKNTVPVYLLKRYVPDVYYVAAGVIASLYLGGVVKIISGIVLKLVKADKAEEDIETGEAEECEEEKSTTEVTPDEPTEEDGEFEKEEKVAEAAQNETVEEDGKSQKEEKTTDGKMDEPAGEAGESAEDKDTEGERKES